MSKYSHNDLGLRVELQHMNCQVFTYQFLVFPPIADLRWTFKQKDLMIITVARIRMRGRRRNMANAELIMPPAFTEG